MTPLVVGLIGVGFLLLLLFSGVHVAIAMALVGFFGFAYVNGLPSSLAMLGMTIYATLFDYIMSVMPLFIAMGALAHYSGISTELYNTAYKWLGQLKGGLALTTIGACASFSAISGTSSATAATMTKIGLPEMQKYRYAPTLSTGTLAAGGTLGIMIPPSTILIFYGLLTEQSIGQLFIAGIFPGVILTLLFVLVIFLSVSLNPSLGPKGPRVGLRDKISSLRAIWPVLVLFGLVMGGLYLGVFTPTEAGGIGAFGALLIGIVKKKIDWRTLSVALSEAAQLTAMIMIMVACGMVFNKFLLVTQLPMELANAVSQLEVNRYLILSGIVLTYFVLGCVMDMAAMMVLTIPIYFPLVVSLGFDPIWFGVIVVIMMEQAMITPPVGLNVFIISGMAKDVSMSTIFRGVAPFWLAMVVLVVLLVVFPQIALFLTGR